MSAVTPPPRSKRPCSPSTIRRNRLLRVEKQLPITQGFIASEAAAQKKREEDAAEEERLREIERSKQSDEIKKREEELRRQKQREEAELAALRNGASCCHRSWRWVNPGPYARGKPLPYTLCNFCGETDFEPLEDQRETPEERAIRIFNEARPAQRTELQVQTAGYLPETPSGAYTFCTTVQQ